VSKDKGGREARKPKKDKKAGAVTSSVATAVSAVPKAGAPKK